MTNLMLHGIDVPANVRHDNTLSRPLRDWGPIGAEPDGHITLEWRRSPRRVLSVSVDPEVFLHYAGLFGSNRRWGSLAFFSTAPDELLQLVREL